PCRGHVPEFARAPGRLGDGRPVDEARRAHADPDLAGGRPAGALGLSGDPAMKRPSLLHESDSAVDRGEHHAHHDQLEETWSRSNGVVGWFRAVDHKRIGLRFIVTALTFFAMGG